jgi:hypothetical protein
MKKRGLKPGEQRRLERKQQAALEQLMRTSKALGEKAHVRIRGEVTRSYIGRRGRGGADG